MHLSLLVYVSRLSYNKSFEIYVLAENKIGLDVTEAHFS